MLIISTLLLGLTLMLVVVVSSVYKKPSVRLLITLIFANSARNV